jgi:hypothetical protein
MRICVALLALALLAGTAAAKDPDRDRDGLSDFQEVHKYRTDPDNRDSDGDGKKDGDWDERREFTYSIRTVIRVMRPVNEDALVDDYQDARILKKTKEYLELEVVHYPLNTNKEAIVGVRDWRKTPAALRQYLKAGVTTNWDAGMRKALLAEIGKAGIDPEKLSDKEVVEKVADWALRRAKYRYMFCTYYVIFPKRKPTILPGLEASFEKEKGDPSWSVAEEMERELYGKGMFEHRTRGTCTSSAIYLTTVMRAVGIPSRMVIGVPAVDTSDAAQLEMIRKGVTHHGARAKIYPTLAKTSGFAAHTYNEVWVGGRWRRLNYERLGANTMDPRCFGLMTHVHRFDDLSEAGLAETWGKRYATGERSKAFPGSNPYSTLEVTDLFGPHAKIENPEVAAPPEHRHLTITKVYWWGSEDQPDYLADKEPPKPEGGNLAVHVDEWFPDQDYTQIKLFLNRADRSFVLRAEGHPDVRAVMPGPYYTAGGGVREIHLHIPPQEFAKMAKGVDYTLHPAKSQGDYVWRVGEEIVVSR